MDVFNKIKSLKKKADNNNKAKNIMMADNIAAKTIIMSAILGVSSPAFSKDNPQAEQDSASSSITQTIETQAKQYHKIIEVKSIQEMSRHDKAYYDSTLDAIYRGR